MVDKTTFIIYMISTTIAIIVLGSMCIKNMKRDIELLELIYDVDKIHYKFEKELINQLSKTFKFDGFLNNFKK